MKRFFAFPDGAPALTALALLVACCAAAVPASRADFAPPVDIRMLGEVRLAVAGVPLSGEIEVVCGEAGELTGFDLGGTGWRVDRFAAPAPGPFAAGEHIVIAFTATPRDPDQPLEFRCSFDGHALRSPFDFSPAHYRRVTAAGARRLADALPLDAEAAGAPFPEPLWVQPVEKSAEAISITVVGGWAYELPDTCNRPPIRVADITVQVLANGNQVALTRTNDYGYFSATFDWNLYTGYPSVQIVVMADNDRVRCVDYTTGYLRTWYSYVYPNVQAGTLDVGVLSPSDDFLQPVLHQFQTIGRIHDWYDDEGYPLGRITVRFPGDGEYFGGTTITIPSVPYNPDFPDARDPAWNDGGYAHEYTHFWQSVYAPAPGLPYCNGVCDASATVCGHCYWCPEEPLVVMVEGFAGVMGNYLPWQLNILYGVPIIAVDDNESIFPCLEPGYVGWDAENTEGMYASLLYDMMDSNQDQHLVFDVWRDRLTESPSRVLAVTRLDNPTDPADFVAHYKSRYPAVDREDLWETAANCGMDFDLYAPGTVGNLHSTSHTVGVPSADPTIDMAWDRANDDMSGPAGYSIYVGHTATMPDQVAETGDVTSYHVPAQEPGMWVVCVRTVDRSGKWGTSYLTSGPYEIREAEPADLGPYTSWGWYSPLVPRENASAMGTNVPAPVTLTGETASTWWNYSGKNFGEAATSGGFTCDILLDSELLDQRSWGTISGGGSYMDVNKGPFTVRPGRHILSVWNDSAEQIPETDETNNRWGHQWIWSPTTTLPIGTLLTRAAPPAATAGWGDVVDGSTVFYNCDGVSLNSINYIGSYYSWDAVYLYADDDSLDYDCRLHPHTTGPQDGFSGTNQLGTSIRDAGCLDAVLFNGNNDGAVVRDVGVLNRHEPFGTGDYKLMRLRASELAPGNTATTTLGQGAMMAFHRVPFDAADTNWVTVKVTVDPPTQPATFNWYLPSFTHGKLEEYDLSYPVQDGLLKFQRHVAEIGRHGAIVYRDPRDGRDPCTITVTFGPPEPDFTSYQALGWAAPAVPRPVDDGTSRTVALPDTLYGDVAATWLNFAWRNVGKEGFRAKSVSPLMTDVAIDGETVISLGTLDEISASEIVPTNDHTARTVQAGRHTMTLVTDATGVATELVEDNNAWGGQYCWSPALLDFAMPVTRSSPPDRTAGWDAAPDDVILYYNCDGLRLPASAAATWRAMAVMPEVGGDVDVRLHSPLQGASGGYAGVFVSSGWGQDACDFVLVDGYAPPGGSTVTSALDAGVVLPDSASGYRAEAVVASLLVPGLGGAAGPFTLDAGHLMHLYELDLAAGNWRIDLTSLSGTVDWGLSLYAPPMRFLAKSSTVPGGIAWDAGPGANERIIVTVDEPGRYALAVWKTDARVLDEAGSYRLTVAAPVTGVDDDGPPPARSGLVSVHPNPFNPRTEISYELSGPADVQIAVYDLRGRRVRSLVDGPQPAGRHAVTWTGLSDHGDSAAGGVYLIRMRTAEESWTRKVSLLK